MPDEFINVALTKVPGVRTQYSLNGERTLAALLELAEMGAEGYNVRLNGTETDNMSAELSNNDEVVLVKMIKGNA